MKNKIYRFKKQNISFQSNKPHIYKITNCINKKIYVGVHNGNYTDIYSGSSMNLQAAYKKYGIDNFTKDLIKEFDSEEEAYKFEAEYVNETFVKRKDTYNLQVGGYGSGGGKSNPMYGKTHSDKVKKDTSDRFTNTTYVNNGEISRRIKVDLLQGFLNDGWQRGRMKFKVFKVDKEARSKKTSEKNTGRRWINNGTKNKFVDDTTLNQFLQEGWVFGYIQKKSVCPHCGKTGRNATIKRWHFDNCKSLKD